MPYSYAEKHKAIQTGSYPFCGRCLYLVPWLCRATAVPASQRTKRVQKKQQVQPIPLPPQERQAQLSCFARISIQKQLLHLPHSTILSEGMLPDEKTLVLACSNYSGLIQKIQVDFWDVAKKSLLHHATLQTSGTVPVDYSLLSPGGSLFVTRGWASKSNINIWDTKTGELQRTLEVEPFSDYNLAFWPNQNVLTGVGRSDVRQWDVHTGKLLRSFRKPVDGTLRGYADFGKDGITRVLVFIGADYHAHFQN